MDKVNNFRDRDSEMRTHTEKRVHRRYPHIAPIAFSYFNNHNCHDALIYNHCMNGMNFKSNFPLKPRTTLYIRLKKFPPNAFFNHVYEGLHTVVIGEVKWCRRIPDADDHAYGVGIKYLPPVY